LNRPAANCATSSNSSAVSPDNYPQIPRRSQKKRLLFLSKAVAARVEASGNRLLRLPRLSIRTFLEEFKKTIEAEAVNSFWESRTKGKLKRRCEKLGQEILGVFARAKLAGRGSAIREAVSGVGFVDVLVTFSSGLLHVVELKVLKTRDVPGPAQLATYMAHRNRREGWLVFFDTRKPNHRAMVPPTLRLPTGTIRSVVIDINPTPPHLLNARAGAERQLCAAKQRPPL
jgi:hypothetical protein